MSLGSHKPSFLVQINVLKNAVDNQGGENIKTIGGGVKVKLVQYTGSPNRQTVETLSRDYYHFTKKLSIKYRFTFKLQLLVVNSLKYYANVTSYSYRNSGLSFARENAILLWRCSLAQRSRFTLQRCLGVLLRTQCIISLPNNPFF